MRGLDPRIQPRWRPDMDRRLFTTVISQAEIFSGIANLPEGRRRAALETAAEAMFAEDLAGRVLPFDAAAAGAYAEIFAAHCKAGRPTAPLNLMIAAIACAPDATVATRDVGGFTDCVVAVVNPWRAYCFGSERAWAAEFRAIGAAQRTVSFRPFIEGVKLSAFRATVTSSNSRNA